LSQSRSLSLIGLEYPRNVWWLTSKAKIGALKQDHAGDRLIFAAQQISHFSILARCFGGRSGRGEREGGMCQPARSPRPSPVVYHDRNSIAKHF
jgi:hypothetical protein